ncbi:RING-H2 finger protein ATL64-like [Fagus crenata]
MEANASHNRRNNRRRRRRRRRANQLLLHPNTPTSTITDSLSSQGLDPSILKALTTFTYSSKTHEFSSLKCSVCLSEFEDDDQGRVLPKCEHAFHVECIDTWFQSHSNCPLCRAPVQADIPALKPEISAETESEPSGSRTEPVQIEAPEMGSSGFPQRVSLVASDGQRRPFELVGIVVEVPRPRGLHETGLCSPPGRHGLKHPGNRVITLKRIWSI